MNASRKYNEGDFGWRGWAELHSCGEIPRGPPPRKVWNNQVVLVLESMEEMERRGPCCLQDHRVQVWASVISCERAQKATLH